MNSHFPDPNSDFESHETAAAFMLSETRRKESTIEIESTVHSTASTTTSTTNEAKKLTIDSLSSSVTALDANTQNLLNKILASTDSLALEDSATDLADFDGLNDLGSSQIEFLMKQMDNTFNALGELEARAEDILGKLDGFLRDSGYEGSFLEDDVDDVDVDADVDGNSFSNESTRMEDEADGGANVDPPNAKQ
ncbi:hypothetical protein HK100_004547 [Physocladia obscura]|uniref:Uncharacterized protein n=1 Tax=Physocladia obscura TaxID=109957 RepID=A0AAD5XCX7_9FUNG|nr:hypothetical protein HK100_004547 [Physocladia obscura]